MLIKKLKLSGFLSFGPGGVDLPMEPLNVLIGPNGSGKSNFLEAIALLRAAPRDISESISRMGGTEEWIWKGPKAPDSFSIEAWVDYPPGGPLRHKLMMAERSGQPKVINEQVESCQAHGSERETLSYYRPPKDKQIALEISRANAEAEQEDSGKKNDEWSAFAVSRDGTVNFADEFHPEQSLLSCIATPLYPELWHLKEQYSKIRLYRNWSFGPSPELRRSQSTHDRSDFLDDGGANLFLVLSNFHGETKRELVTEMCKLFDGIIGIECSVAGGLMTLHLEESDNRLIPITRLSDGTLRYLCLLSILLHPDPPPLVVIEEPELGIHPDLLPTLSDLLVKASDRTQLIVTTHSDVLVDALNDNPQSMVICEKHNGQTEMRRLDKKEIGEWLEEYRLGHLWTSGELGGNRW